MWFNIIGCLDFDDWIGNCPVENVTELFIVTCIANVVGPVPSWKMWMPHLLLQIYESEVKICYYSYFDNDKMIIIVVIISVYCSHTADRCSIRSALR